MTARLLPESESELRNAVEALNADSWPQDMAVEYGEVELRLLCDRFLMPFSDVKPDFREYEASGGKTQLANFKKLVNRVSTLLVNTASCERGFSKTNAVCN